jgi:hypothetical protein
MRYAGVDWAERLTVARSTPADLSPQPAKGTPRREVVTGARRRHPDRGERGAQIPERNEPWDSERDAGRQRSRLVRAPRSCSGRHRPAQPLQTGFLGGEPTSTSTNPLGSVQVWPEESTRTISRTVVGGCWPAAGDGLAGHVESLSQRLSQRTGWRVGVATLVVFVRLSNRLTCGTGTKNTTSTAAATTTGVTARATRGRTP